MSDENTPKLRLRPKLAGGPPPFTPAQDNVPASADSPAPASPAVTSTPIAPPPVALKPTGLRPKLTIKPDSPGEGGSPATPPPPGKDITQIFAASDPRSFPPPPVKPALGSASLRPKVISNTPSLPGENPPTPTNATPPFPFPPPTAQEKLPAVLNAPPPPSRTPTTVTQESWPSVLDAPPPPGLGQAAAQRSTEPEPAEITAIRKASTYPFPAPTAKFPPLPGLTASGDSAPPESTESEGLLRKIVLFGGIAFVLLVVGAGWAYFKYFAKPPAGSAPTPAPTAATPQSGVGGSAGKIKEAIKKAEQDALAPINEIISSEQGPTTSAKEPALSPSPAAESPVVTAPAPDLVPVTPPPPPPSAAFKAWVINLKIRGVRGGDAQRVFIDRTSYVPGDLVNPPMGIFFVGYDDTTRMLIFQDKTGAQFSRRH